MKTQDWWKAVTSLARLASGLVVLMYVDGCILPGEPSDHKRVQFQLDFELPYRVPIGAAVVPPIQIVVEGRVIDNPPYRLESHGPVEVDSTGHGVRGIVRDTASVRVVYPTATGTPDTIFPIRVVVSRVAVDPSEHRLTRLGDGTLLSAAAFAANGDLVPNTSFTWSTSDSLVATVSNSGVAIAVDEGAATITAEADEVRGSASLTVAQLAGALQVTPELDSLRTVHQTRPFIVFAFDSAGRFLPLAKPRWTSSDTTVAVMDQKGRASATGRGTTKIIARIGGTVDTATLIVAPVTRFLFVTPPIATVTAIGDTTRLTALAADSFNVAIPRPSVTWAISDTTIATVDTTGLVRSARNGAVLVSALAGGQSAFAAVVVRQEVATVQLTEDSLALTGAGDTARVNAVGLDKTGHAVNGAVFAWRTSNASVATVDSTGLVTARASGRVRIVATSGDARPDTAIVTVTGAPQPELIAFVSNRDGASHIYVMNPDGSGVTKLTTVGGNAKPAWSPDGRIAFSRGDDPSTRGVYVMQADGSGLTRLTESGDNDPAWSPDGSRIAFSRWEGASRYSIYVMNADASGITKLTGGAYDTRPAWSPDGIKIAFDRTTAGAPYYCCITYIYVIDADGSNLRRLISTYEQYPESGAAWSPNGAQVVLFYSFYSYPDDYPGLAVVAADGSGRPRIVYQDFPAVNASSHPDWSADSKTIAFTRYDKGVPNIWLLRMDNLALSSLTAPLGGWDGAWSRGSRE